MKRLPVVLCLFCLLTANINGQVKPAELTAAEEREAKNLAASFFNRFRQTQDLAPLLRQYFVRDFARRLKFCRNSGECEGEGKDFWRQREDLAAFNATETDFQRMYALSMSDLFLSYRTIGYLVDRSKINEKSYESVAKSLAKELKFQSRNNPRILKFGFFGNSNKDGSDDFFRSNFKNLKELRRYLDGYEKYLAILKVVESKSRTRFQKEKSGANTFFSPADFRVSVEENRRRFFDYPVEKRMLEIWDEGDLVPFVMNLIGEDGRLKIVAIYPPMD